MPFTSRERSPSGLLLPIITRENPATFDQEDEFTNTSSALFLNALSGKSDHGVEKPADYSRSSPEPDASTA
jgi:hypothetical protein